MEHIRPSAGASGNLSRYFRGIHILSILGPEAERALAHRWRDRHDISAGYQLVASHLRLVVKLAKGYRGYSLPLEDLIGEGHVGLMRALCRFDPDRGARFATYAIWWVHSAIREYVLDNWSMVKMDAATSRRQLFFNLRRLRALMQAFDGGTLEPEHACKIAASLRVPEHDVLGMSERMAGRDYSLNAPSGDAKVNVGLGW